MSIASSRCDTVAMTKNVNIRFPDELHARIKEAAAQDRRSFNSEVLALIEASLPETPSSPRLKAGASGETGR